MTRQDERSVAAGEVAGVIHLQPLLRVRPQPLVTNPPPFILDSQHSTLNIIDKVDVINL